MTVIRPAAPATPRSAVEAEPALSESTWNGGSLDRVAGKRRHLQHRRQRRRLARQRATARRRHRCAAAAASTSTTPSSTSAPPGGGLGRAGGAGLRRSTPPPDRRRRRSRVARRRSPTPRVPPGHRLTLRQLDRARPDHVAGGRAGRPARRRHLTPTTRPTQELDRRGPRTAPATWDVDPLFMNPAAGDYHAPGRARRSWTRATASGARPRPGRRRPALRRRRQRHRGPRHGRLRAPRRHRPHDDVHVGPAGPTNDNTPVFQFRSAGRRDVRVPARRAARSRPAPARRPRPRWPTARTASRCGPPTRCSTSRRPRRPGSFTVDTAAPDADDHQEAGEAVLQEAGQVQVRHQRARRHLPVHAGRPGLADLPLDVQVQREGRQAHAPGPGGRRRPATPTRRRRATSSSGSSGAADRRSARIASPGARWS